MRKPLLWGIAAGAVGTIALDIVGYLDMLVRARPASSTPAEVAGALAERAGVELAADGNDSESAGNRRSGLGALLGYGVGLGVGAAYGLLRSLRPAPRRPWPAVAGLGLVAMAASDLPATALGVTDPRSWGAAGWASDVLPHLAYGVATATVYEALAGRSG
jgi:xanthosine utilization system XapX-like protein